MGFKESIFRGVHNDTLYERFKAEILQPEFPIRENGTLISALMIIPKRWWHNRWKNRICYSDNLFSTFVYGVWGKLMKPVHFIQ